MRRNAHSFTVLTYHRVGDAGSGPPGIVSCTPEQFERHMAWLGRSGRAVPLGALLLARAGGRPLPRGSVLVTFVRGQPQLYFHGRQLAGQAAGRAKMSSS